MVGSSYPRSTSIIPIGKLSRLAHGTDIAGCPLIYLGAET